LFLQRIYDFNVKQLPTGETMTGILATYETNKADLKQRIMKFFETRTQPCEISVIATHMRSLPLDYVLESHFTIFATSDLIEQGDLWGLGVPEEDPESEYLIVGRPTMIKPTDPIGFLGLVIVTKTF
jgi:hypothetical protein